MKVQLKKLMPRTLFTVNEPNYNKEGKVISTTSLTYSKGTYSRYSENEGREIECYLLIGGVVQDEITKFFSQEMLVEVMIDRNLTKT